MFRILLHKKSATMLGPKNNFATTEAAAISHISVLDAVDGGISLPARRMSFLGAMTIALV